MPSDAAGAGAGSDLPDIDDHLVEPGTRYEMLDGKVVYVPPSDAPHGERQFQLCALVAAHTGSDIQGASDLLTRTSKRDDVAPDVSLYPGVPDPGTGRRQLAQIAFEVVSTQSLSDAGKKAASLVARGVRRVFAIDVEHSRVLEWSAALGTWSMLDPGATIADPALAVPLPIETLIREGKTDDAVQRALAAKGNPVLESIKATSRAEGMKDGMADGIRRGTAGAVVAVLEARGMVLERSERDRLLDEQDLARLERWIARAIACASVDELLAEP